MNNLYSISRKFTAAVSLSLLLSSNSIAQQPPEPALLIIGGSYANASVPFNDNLDALFGGIAVNFGSFLSLGNALARDPRLPGYVLNEAQAGATSFDRSNCNPGPQCGPASWQGFETQLKKAVARVRNPFVPGLYNAKYVVISEPNDCLHSDAFGIPQNQTSPCTPAQMNAFIDRLIAVGRQALDMGITPIYSAYPKYSDLDLPKVQAAFGLYWVIDETSFNELRELHRTRLQNELSGAVVLDIWNKFEDIGDGLHPNDKTVKKAAAIIAQYITAQKPDK